MSKLKKLFPGLKQHFFQLRENLKPMGFWEKLDHIWTYYKAYMFVALMLCLILVVIVSSALNRNVQFYNCGIMSNVELSREGHDYLTDVFYKDILGAPKGKTYLTATTLPTQEQTVTDTANSFERYMNVLAQIEGKDLDYMLLDEYSFGFYVDDRIYLDLRKLLSEEALSALYAQDQIVHVREEAEEIGTPMGIDISQTPFARDCVLTQGKTYLVFIRNTEQPENCLKLWEHIENWEQYSVTEE